MINSKELGTFPAVVFLPYMHASIPNELVFPFQNLFFFILLYLPFQFISEGVSSGSTFNNYQKGKLQL